MDTGQYPLMVLEAGRIIRIGEERGPNKVTMKLLTLRVLLGLDQMLVFVVASQNVM